MNMSVRSESFHAVGEQVAATLRDAHLALEIYAEGEPSPPELQKCVDLLHSARGALNVASIYGAGLLAEEMEVTCQYLQESDKSSSSVNEGIEALSRAMVQLPTYIERIVEGGKDIPLVMLPLLNDLRAARGKPLLSESTLLLLNGSPLTKAGYDVQPHPSGEDISEQLGKLRPQFQLGLLGWIKGTETEKNLQRMSQVVEKLEQAAAVQEAYRLWWVVGGVLEGLADDGLQTGIALKRLLGQVDREIKRQQEFGEQVFAGDSPADLINNLLYYVARASSSGPHIVAIKAAFHLDELAPAEEQVDELRESLAAPSPQLMKTVAGAISEDLTRAKDVLDIYVRTGMEDPLELEGQVALLGKIADTLGVLGLGHLREAVAGHSAELAELAADQNGVDESRLVALAAALLEVEDRLENELVGLVRSPASEAPVDADYQAVTEAVLRECRINLAHIKDLISEVLDNPEDRRRLDSLPDLIGGVSAGLTMLGFQRAVEVLGRIGEAISKHLQGGALARDPGRLNRLADAIVSVEYYMETLQSGRREPVYMLENAERSLEVLEDAESPDQEAVEEIPVVEKTCIIEAPVMQTADEQPDLDLLETFIEEAREEVEAINRHFPVWLENIGDDEALITIRRSYHTIKGSGRMVGAQLFGEYAWNIENLLNRIINKTVTAGPELQAFLADAIAATAQLLEQLEAGADPEADIEALAEDAEHFASGEIPDNYQQVVTAETEAEIEAGLEDEPAEEELVESEPQVVAIDPVLLSILERESAGHLVTVREHLAQSAAEGIAVDEAMHHACHTLHGSITMAEVQQAAGLTSALNQFIEQFYEREQALDATQRNFCAAAADAIELHIAHLLDDTVELPDTADLEARLRKQAGELAEDTEAESGIYPAVEAGPAEARPVEEPVTAAVEPGSEFDAEIAAIFCEEAAEILGSADQSLQMLAGNGNSADTLAELQRHLHTIKGGARMAGIPTMGDFSHELETLLIRVSAGGGIVDAEMRGLLQLSIDELHRMQEQVLEGALVPVDAELLNHVIAASNATMVVPVIEALPEQPEEEQDEIADVQIEDSETDAAEIEQEPEIIAGEEPLKIPEPEDLGALAQELISGKPPEQPEPLPDSLSPSLAPVAEAAQRKDMARVDAAMLEELLNNAGEISISHSRLKTQVSSIQFNLEELGQTVQRLQQQLRLLEMETEAQILFKHQNDADADADAEFDPLELDRYSTIQQLSRGLGETASDVSSLKDLLQNIASDTESILSQQQRVATDLQDSLMRTRMVPFEQHVPRLQRLVRQQAQENGKQVELVVSGSSGELDRQVMERMIAPFEHMLRNAVVHGIETTEQRVQQGKPANATITIAFRREGSHVLIDVADDGAGVDLDSVRAKAVEQGVVSKDQELTEEELAQLILRSGLSTADELTKSAGRGVGMDVVVNEIGKLGGMLAISTEKGKGCTFTVRLPYTLAITQAFIVRAGSETYALPLPSVEGVVRITREEFDRSMAEDEPAIEYGGRRYRLQHLGLYLGLGPARIGAEQDHISVILVEAGENSTALITDETADAREIVVKPVGSQLAGIRGIAGATILGDGRIVVILDAAAIVRMPVPEVDAEQFMREEEENLPPLALVVDDSITMRRVTQRLLERNGMRVLTAKDGVEVLELLQDHHPRIILLDVEMPRMDGYEFAGRVRGNPVTADLPIIMVTSRSGEKHRARAIELGVNDYLGKPYQEHEMIDAINVLLDEDISGGTKD